MHPSLLTLKILCVMWKQTHHDMKLVPQGVCHTIMRAELDSGSLRNKIEASHAAFLVLKWKQPVSTRRCSEEMWLAHRVISVSHIITSKQIKYCFIICTVYCRQLDFFFFFLANVFKHKYWIMLLMHVTKRWKMKATGYKSIVYCNRELLFIFLMSPCHV